MRVWVISYVEEGMLKLRAFRDLWSAMDAAETMKGESLDWDVPRETPTKRRTTTAGKVGVPPEVTIDEVTVEPSESDVRVAWVHWETAAVDANTVQHFVNGVSMGVDERPPFEKEWTRPEGQLEPVEFTALVTRHDGTTRQGIIATVD